MSRTSRTDTLAGAGKPTWKKKYLIQHPEKFDDELKEIIVPVTWSASRSRWGNDKYWQASLRIPAYVDCASGELVRGKRLLVWDLKSEKKIKFRLKENTCARLIVRESLEFKNPLGITVEHGRQLFVVGVVKRKTTEPQAEKIIEEFRRDVTTELSDGTVLTLNRRCEHYEGSVKWLGQEVEVILDIDTDDIEGSTAAAVGFLERMLADAESWDTKTREYAGENLAENVWESQSQEDGEEIAITPEDFARRIGLPLVCVSYTGDFEYAYDDDGMYWGHIVVVRGNMEHGFTEALIEG